ncbi:uncharacterized protein LOC106740264 isoform X3 [Alligator mississippiensis]|uniref:uncharacterized protein LOC106740264 isoform X3 n=1 Tax=Alligator mississippiensis TaxID=8496 RepID=UPI00090708D5|nr:uncharacterized protein LOC106740264 isoform X3 [Alligator mississippiensis]
MGLYPGSSWINPFNAPMTLAFLSIMLCAPQRGMAKRGSEQTVVEAGSELALPCSLRGPSLMWIWVPQYPLCARQLQQNTHIFTWTSAKTQTVKLAHFQYRLHLRGDPWNGDSYLVLTKPKVSDSGLFSCTNGNQTASTTQVTVTPGCQEGASISVPAQRPLMKGVTVTLRCAPCAGGGTPASTSHTATWSFNGKTADILEGVRQLRMQLTIKFFSARYQALGSLWTHQHFPIVAGSLAGALGLILIGALTFVCFKRHQTRRASQTPIVLKAEGHGDQAAEYPTRTETKATREMKSSPNSDPSPEGSADVQYTTLQFKEPSVPTALQGALVTSRDGPSTIYSEVLTPCS